MKKIFIISILGLFPLMLTGGKTNKKTRKSSLDVPYATIVIDTPHTAENDVPYASIRFEPVSHRTRSKTDKIDFAKTIVFKKDGTVKKTIESSTKIIPIQ